MKEFDEKYRNEGRYKNFETNKKNKYAISYQGRLYPVKKIIELSTGRPVSTFSGGAGRPNDLIRSLGFDVINMRENKSDSDDSRGELV